VNKKTGADSGLPPADYKSTVSLVDTP